MAPEQLEGKDADARTDIFAFGALLYEMVTGKKAFEGTSQASLISAIMSSQPPKISERQPMSPRELDHIVERCLAKHPDERWQTASDVMRELMWVDTVRNDDVSRSTTRSSLTNWVWPLAAAVVAGLAVAFFLPEGTDADRSVSRAVIPIADSFTVNFVSNVALSPDGKRLVYVAGKQLYVRPIESMEATPIAGTEGARVTIFLS